MKNAIPSKDDGGFIMVAILVGMAIAAIWMTAALPSWRQQVQRTREENLIFYGEQYARAIVLYQNKNQNALPPSIDVLVQQHYLRKKWKDPVTGDDFAPVGIGIVQAPTLGQQSTLPTGRGNQATAPINTGGSNQPGITGVRSKSTATSIKIYQQQQQYNLWQFDAAIYRQAHGMQQAVNPNQGRQGGPAGGPGRAGPGGAAGPGGVGGPGRGGTPPAAPVPGGGRAGRGGN